MSEEILWKLEEQEREAILALPARERYTYFLQVIVDWDEAWALQTADGWVLAATDEGDSFPLWPHTEFAKACAQGEWEGATPAPIGLDELLEDLLPILEEDRISVAAFPTPDGDGILVSPQDLRQHLQAEIELGEAGEDDTETE